jgi:uncharacterized phage infection (PIP) family protein YhgE
MLTAKNLERIIELEDNLRSEYQSQLDAKSAEIEGHIKDKEGHIKDKEDQKAVIAKQLEQITTFSSEASANKKVEQLNRELNNRSDNLQDEMAELRKRVKGLQKDLAQEREELKTLKQFDPAKMKKNLDANKRKLAEKTDANNLLQQTANKAKSEKSELERKVKELEAKLEELQPAEEEEAETQETEAA